MGSLMNLSSIPFYEVCIDDSSAENIAGRMYCGVKPEGVPFVGVEKLVFEMESIMDRIKFPEAAIEKRSFAGKSKMVKLPLQAILESQKEMKKFNPDIQSGKKATLIAQIQFRQNSTWQGFVKWVEGNETYKFESELEFIQILEAVAKK